jgi:hypothetical protein
MMDFHTIIFIGLQFSHHSRILSIIDIEINGIKLSIIFNIINNISVINNISIINNTSIINNISIINKIQSSLSKAYSRLMPLNVDY